MTYKERHDKFEKEMMVELMNRELSRKEMAEELKVSPSQITILARKHDVRFKIKGNRR